MLVMKDLRELFEKCLDLLQDIYNLALIEDFEKAKQQYFVLKRSISELLEAFGEKSKEMSEMIRKIEKIYYALEKGDGVKVIDIAGYEMKPIIQQYLESIGE